MDAITERKHKLKRGLVFPFNKRKGPVNKGAPYGRIIQAQKIANIDFGLHATKVWRHESPKRAIARFVMAQMRGV